jgi:arylformamidase
MKIQLTATLADMRYDVNLSRPRNIAIPVHFEGPRLCVFGVPPARRQPFATAGFIGDVCQGGSCNCDIYTFSPHTSGTHTECVGHISSVPIAVHDILQVSLIPVTLITVTPQPALATDETYDPALGTEDRLITRAALERSLRNASAAFLEGVVIRTAPNGPVKLTQNYDKVRPAFFSIEGIRYLVGLGVKHLLTDIPSIDRLDDEGRLTNHHIFWEVPPGHHPGDTDPPSLKTITELIYADDDIADGIYLLNLQVAPFMADASPSRPILYELTAYDNLP